MKPFYLFFFFTRCFNETISITPSYLIFRSIVWCDKLCIIFGQYRSLLKLQLFMLINYYYSPRSLVPPPQFGVSHGLLPNPTTACIIYLLVDSFFCNFYRNRLFPNTRSPTKPLRFYPLFIEFQFLNFIGKFIFHRFHQCPGVKI